MISSRQKFPRLTKHQMSHEVTDVLLFIRCAEFLQFLHKSEAG